MQHGMRVACAAGDGVRNHALPPRHVAESQQARAVLLPRRTVLLVGVGLLAFHLSHLLAGREEGVWLPALGVGLALTAWLGLRVVALLAIDSILARLQTRPDFPIAQICLDGLLFAAQIGVSWWAFQKVAEARRRLEDPQAATVFLILVPGVLAGLFALIQASFWTLAGITDLGLAYLAGTLWISRILGILTWTPFLLVGITPYLVKGRVIAPDPAAPVPGGVHPDDWSWGEVIEASGLALGSAVLTLVVVALHQESATPSWALWGISLLLVVWASLRQGLRGGSFVAMVGGTAGLTLAGWQGLTAAGFSPLQGNILAQCSTALLVGASAGWIRASEARYRQVVGQIPVVLYSVRLPRGFTLPKAGQRRNRAEDAAGGDLVRQAEVTLVSTAARNIFRCEPDDLLGPYARWLERIKPEDRELLLAALAQLSLQRQPVTCEYRLLSDANLPDAHAASPAPCWLRDTLAPNYLADGTLSGWEGVIENISEQRALSHTLRRTNSMFQALVTNLPTGVFFVQGPIGQPLLVNARARQLLGQREDNAAGIAHISKVYRLHRPDGSEYPVDELPVTRALREGVAASARDIVVHRPDGRRTPLITWAAPVNMSGGPTPDAAVWVLEDLSHMQQVETARRESEARLRAVFDTMAEGVLVANHQGEITECNPAACAILGVAADALLGRRFPGRETGCIREDGAPLPAEEQPDRLVLATGEPVRDVPLGIRVAGPGDISTVRWLYVSAMPLRNGDDVPAGSKNARIVITLADISALRKAQDDLRRVHRLELVGRIASGTLHDFNNLLTVMIGLAAVAQTTLPGDHPATADLQRLQEVGEQAGHLAGQLLTFSKHRQQPPRPTDLNTVVVHSLKILKGVVPPRIAVEARVGPEDVWVLADETHLKQIVMNLCLNARDAIDGEGRITVSVSTVSAGVDEDSSAPAEALLAVEDTGAGMDEAVRARIFEPFFSTKERGTGLGLAVVRQIVDELGGRIQVQSEAGRGTRIEVWLKRMEGR